MIGSLIYIMGICLSYSHFKDTKWYFPVGIGLGMITNYLWFSIAKDLKTDKDQLLLYGIYWDSMIISLYVLMPVLIFGARASGWALLGLVLMGLGGILTKI
jgi:hypothetical protein